MGSDTARAESIAGIIVGAFERYLSEFRGLTLRARLHFEEQDWPGAQRDWLARLDLYGRVVADTLAALRAASPGAACTRSLWTHVKAACTERISSRHGAELAETFFNSITRRVFTIVGVEPDLEFVDTRAAACPVGPAAPATRTFVRGGSVEALVRQVLASYRFAPGYEDLARDAALVAQEVEREVLRDRFAQPKTCTRRDVMEKYQLVFKHDRAGRLIDAQEFEYLRFDRDRFAPELLSELLSEAAGTVSLEGDSLVGG
jgi:isocitrate dehydrogenase kinase/phosphatase